MSLTEAQELFSFTRIDRAPGRVILHRLGNGREWCLLIKSSGYFIWSLDDWLNYIQEEEDGILARQQEVAS